MIPVKSVIGERYLAVVAFDATYQVVLVVEIFREAVGYKVIASVVFYAPFQQPSSPKCGCSEHHRYELPQDDVRSYIFQ